MKPRTVGATCPAASPQGSTSNRPGVPWNAGLSLCVVAGAGRSDTCKKSCEVPKRYSMPYGPHSVKVEGQVVHGVEHRRQRLIRRIKVPQIGAGIARTNAAPASRVEWAFVGGVTGILDGNSALRRIKQPVPCRA